MRLSSHITCLMAFAFIVALTHSPAIAQNNPPNILFILVDDLGWADVGYQGDKKNIHTPNIDQLASQGMIFTDAYAACPVCSPTRASILTGQYPARLQLTSHIPSMGPEWNYGRPKDNAPFGNENGVPTRNWLPVQNTTVGHALQQLGYTTAFLGKWHLGHEPYHPTKQGFDVQIGTTNFGQPPSFYAPYKRTWTKPANPKGYLQIDDLAANAKDNEYLTDRLTDEAIKFIAANKKAPWFCYLSYYTVHTPIEPRKDLIGEHSDKYRAMLASMDAAIGRLLDSLKNQDLDQNTAVVFMSDNGGIQGNAPLRSNKGSTYEGGIREPMIVRWPGVTQPATRCSTPVITTDFLPTFVEIAGGKPNPTHLIDGISLVPLLKGATALPRKSLYWHFPHRGNIGTSGAIRQGQFKLIEKFKDGSLELYDLSQDISEQNDLSSKMPQKTRQLHLNLKHWRESVNALMPSGNQ